MLLPPPAPEVTPASILAESTVANLASVQRFRAGQSSSYDRKSRRPGTPDWFANEDWGHYVREETNEGRREWVLADLKGPGALVHQWSANPVGTWRYYFDGETTPRLTTTGKEIAAGRWLGVRDGSAYVASRGCNLYFPISYAKSLRVTVDASDGDPKSMYYLLGHRTYALETRVRSCERGDLPLTFTARADSIRVPIYEIGPDTFSEVPMNVTDRTVSIRPGATSRVLSIDAGGSLYALYLNVSPSQELHSPGVPGARGRAEVLRQLVLEADFDGEPCISAPVADLFGAPPDARAYRTSVSGIQEDGTMTLRLTMPFRKKARVRIRNVGGSPVEVRFRTAHDPRDLGPEALLLHAQFRRHPGGSRPFRDMPVAHLRGRGHYVGTVLHVANPSRAWWGEGDEKVRVDGEAFPSIFGTGTEDYFGYAWSSNVPFSWPYHAQPRADPDGNSGQIANVRWHVLDPIPYTKSLDFDLEQWHWANVESRFATTAFWYAAPGGTVATPLKAADLVVPDGTPPGPEPGAFQGEALEIAERTGGTTEVQSGFADLADAQLWWRDAAPNDRLTLRLPEVPAGRYRIEARVCTAKDYGRHEMSLDGVSLGTRDFYSPELGWKRLTLGTVALRGGHPTLAVAVRPPNSRSEPRNMFALDWIKLVRIR